MQLDRRRFAALMMGLPIAFAQFSRNPTAALAEPADTPESVVETLHDLLLSVMKRASRIGPRERYDILLPELNAIFDYPRMCRVIVGSAWGAAAEQDREGLVAAFSAMSAATYASRFKAFDHERFEIQGTRPGPRDLVLVDTRIVLSDGTAVAITYVLRKQESRWWIVDVLLDRGISELAVRRSEYNAILKESGILGLTATLREKSESLLSEG